LSAAAIAILLVGGWFLRNTQQPGSKRGTANSEAYDAFERGRFFWKKRTEDGLLTGARYFQTAIERDPGFAQAYAGLADCYVLLVLYSDRFSEDDTISRARTAAQRALDLDNHLVEAHTTMAFIRSTYDWDPIGAAEQFDQAVKLDPNYATAHHWRAFNLAQRGLGDAAVTSMRRALDLEPASMIINADLALMLFLARQYDSAIEQARRGIELDQGFYRPYRILSLAFGQKGMHSESVQAATKVVELRKRNPGSVIALAQVLLRQGQTMESRQLFDELTSGLKAQPQLPTPEVELAILYLMLNDREKALEHLELAWTLRDLDLRWLKLDPRVDSLRDDPRFRTLLTKMGVGQ
jgi:tetratricopeptide (TPR) repeat protein